MRTHFSLLPLLFLGFMATYATAQKVTPISEQRLKQLLPATVFIDGENVPTQERNAAMVALPNGKILIASLIETAGYSSAYQEKYSGVLLSQTGFMLGSKSLDPGAYAFGRKKDGDTVTLLVYNLGGDQLGQIATAKQENLRPVKPLQIIAAEDGSARLYLGPYYVAIAGK
ncbi:MAG TPA: hypothetical protein VFU50_12880 [Terriglobales bacterium]|nr:hypothetical protein [Terriglobales bacterium]